MWFYEYFHFAPHEGEWKGAAVRLEDKRFAVGGMKKKEKLQSLPESRTVR